MEAGRVSSSRGVEAGNSDFSLGDRRWLPSSDSPSFVKLTPLWGQVTAPVRAPLTFLCTRLAGSAPAVVRCFMLVSPPCAEEASCFSRRRVSRVGFWWTWWWTSAQTVRATTCRHTLMDKSRGLWCNGRLRTLRLHPPSA